MSLLFDSGQSMREIGNPLLTGQHQRVRSFPAPLRAKQAIEAGRMGADLSPTGYGFLPLHKAGVLIGLQINPQTVHDLVTEYAELAGLAPLAPMTCADLYEVIPQWRGGVGPDQSLAGHASAQTTGRYVGETQRFTDVPADRLGLRVKG